MATYWVADSADTAAAASEGYERAAAAAEKAIALDPDLADSYTARGYLRGSVLWDWSGARADFERALKLNPGDAEAHRRYAHIVLSTMGNLREALEEAEKATAIEPLSALAWSTRGRVHLFAGHLEAAEAALERSLHIAPEQNFAATYLAIVRLQQKRPAEALDEARRSASDLLRLFCSALAFHDLGRTAEAQRSLDELIARFAHSGAYQIAAAQAHFGQREKALDWLERAYAQHDGGLLHIKHDRFLRDLQGEPRYIALLKKMNLPVD